MLLDVDVQGQHDVVAGHRGLRARPLDDVADVGLGQAAPIDDDLAETRRGRAGSRPTAARCRCGRSDRRGGSPRPSWCAAPRAEISFMKPSACAAIVPVRIRPARHGDDLHARADRRRSRSPPSPRARCPRRPAPGAGARGFASRGAVWIRSQTSIAWSPFMPSSARSRAKPSGVTCAGRDVDVVRRADGGQHLPLAVADLAAHGGQHLGPDDAVGGDPEEGVALDHLQVEQAPGERRGTRPARRRAK